MPLPRGRRERGLCLAKGPFRPQKPPDKHGLRQTSGSRPCCGAAGTRDWLPSNRSNSQPLKTAAAPPVGMLERDRGGVGVVGITEYGAELVRRQIPAICSYMNASWYNVAVTSYFHESRTKPTRLGPVSASRRRCATQGVKRSAVRSGATLARRKFRPRPGWCGCGGNSTHCGSPFLWVLSFGEAKAKDLAGGARPAKLNAAVQDERQVAAAK